MAAELGTSWPQKLLLASPRGFCAGVDRAIDEGMKRIQQVRLQDPTGPIYFYHEIIHNQTIRQRFEDLGGVFTDNLELVPVGEPIIYSAHGVSPEVRKQAKQRRLIEYDATCPLVESPHQRARRLAAAGYNMFYIGHAGHDEAIGVLGEAPGRMTLIETVEDIDRNPVDHPEKIAYLTQTTLSQSDTEPIEVALRARYPEIVGPPNSDICYATLNRQKAVRALVTRGAQIVVVVGSKNSSNSTRLAEVALSAGARNSYLLDDASGLNQDWFYNTECVGLTSGASAPEDVFQGVLAWFTKRGSYQFEEVKPNHFKDESNIHFAPPKEPKSAVLDLKTS